MSEIPFLKHKMSQNKYKDIAPSLLFGFTIISIFHWSTGVLTFNCEVRRQNEVKAIIYLLDIHKLLQNANFCASTSSFCLKHTSAKQAILTDVVGLSVETNGQKYSGGRLSSFPGGNAAVVRQCGEPGFHLQRPFS